MGRKAVASLFSLLLLAVAVSGCIAGGDGGSDDGTSDMPTVDDFQGMDYIECMDPVSYTHLTLPTIYSV